MSQHYICIIPHFWIYMFYVNAITIFAIAARRYRRLFMFM